MLNEMLLNKKMQGEYPPIQKFKFIQTYDGQFKFVC